MKLNAPLVQPVGGAVQRFAVAESGTHAVYVADQDANEANEIVNLTIFDATGGAALSNPTNATLTIVDDDSAGSPGTIQFTATSFDVAETSAQATVSVSRSGGRACRVPPAGR